MTLTLELHLNMPKSFFEEFEDLSIEYLKIKLKKLFSNPLIDNINNLD